VEASIVNLIYSREVLKNQFQVCFISCTKHYPLGSIEHLSDRMQFCSYLLLEEALSREQ
jgi:hypothetical protein